MSDLEKMARAFQDLSWAMARATQKLVILSTRGFLVGETDPEIVAPASVEELLPKPTGGGCELAPLDNGNTEFFFHWANGEDYWQYRARWEKPDPQNRA